MCHSEFEPGAPGPTVETEQILVDQIPTLHAIPAGDARGAVVITHDIMGRSPFYEQLAAHLAHAGFHALLPDLFYREGALPEPTFEAAVARLQKLDQPRAISELGRCVAHAHGLDGARERIGSIGFCMGGTLVLDLDAQRDDVATVCYYGFPAGSPIPSPTRAPAPLDEAARMHGPILGFWGDQDEGAGMDNVEKLARALEERSVAFEYEIYPGLGHGFLKTLTDGAHDWHTSACDSWVRALDFLRAHAG